MRKLILAIALLLAAIPAKAEHNPQFSPTHHDATFAQLFFYNGARPFMPGGLDIFFAQTSAGANNGTSCANAFSATRFNTNDSNWTAGNTLHLCGTFSSQLIAQNSGSSGSPITIIFESGAKISLPVCGSGGCLNIASKSWIVADGGTPCGWVGQVNTACNGLVIETASGTAFGNGNVSSFVVVADTCGNCEIRNIETSGYVKTSLTDIVNGDMRGIQNLASAAGGAFFLVHNNNIHDDSSCSVYVPGGANDSGFQAYNNYLHDCNSGQDLSNNNNGTITAFVMHDNHFGSMSKWDTTTPVVCKGHHNSLHAFAFTTSNSGLTFYNNLVDGNWGSCSTSELFLEGAGSNNNNCLVYNNAFLATYTQMNNGAVNVTCNGFIKVYNNTIIGSLQSGDQGLIASFQSGGSTTFDIRNNIVSGFNTIVNAQTGGTWDFNTYGGCPSGTPFTTANGGTFYSFTAWQAAMGESHSTFGASTSYVKVNSNGTLQAGSPAIAPAGVNLNSLSITPLARDITGALRTVTLPWDQGPFNFGSTPPSPGPTVPTGILPLATIVVQSAPIPPVVITTASMPNGTVGTAYPQTPFTMTGGKPPITWSATGLPTGVTLSTTGVPIGNPTVSGTYSPKVTATDSSIPALTASKTYTVTISALAVPVISQSAMPIFQATVPVSWTFTASGCAAPVCKWSTTGTLPPGMSLVSISNTTASLIGTPTAAGSYSGIVIQVQ